MNIASFIDHTLLRPTTTAANVRQLCKEAKQYGFAAVCIPPLYVQLAVEELEDTEVKVATVIGFPFGYSTAQAKMQEMEEAIADGADELDMVHNLAALKNGDWEYLESEIALCTQLVHDAGKTIKVIIESGMLTDEEIIKCCELYGQHDIDFMKTSTGYAEVGATVHAVQLMRRHLPEHIQIKASGGIRTFAFAKELAEVGATRIGCSASIKIIEESTIV